MDKIFRFVIDRRWFVIAIFALLLPPAARFALRVGQDNSLDRLIVEDDPDALATRQFAKTFGSGQLALLVVEADDPFAPEVLARIDTLEQSFARLPGVETESLLATFRRAKAGFDISRAAEFRAFATGTTLFKKQGLVGEHFLAIPLILDIHSTAERHALVGALDGIVAWVEQSPGPIHALRKVGQPYVDEYLDSHTAAAARRSFPLFIFFVVLINLALYRSWRALLAFLLALGTATGLTVGFIGVTGGVFTIVSSLVPMTVLISCASTLVYLHSRYAECPDTKPARENLLFTLKNKFLACTASLFAAAVGFAALAVSDIQPIRLMGLWVAAGLFITWLVVFTLFPALELVLRVPAARHIGPGRFERFVDKIPSLSRRWRWLLVPAALLLCLAGGVALLGAGQSLPAMRLQTAGVEYIDHDSTLYRDSKVVEAQHGGLALSNLWLIGKKRGAVTDPEVLRGLDALERSLAADPAIGGAVGPANILRTLRYLQGRGDTLPNAPAELEAAAEQLEALTVSDPALKHYVAGGALDQTHIDVVSRSADWQDFRALEKTTRAHFQRAIAAHPVLGDFELRVVGLGPLQAKISHHLVPTLVKSFALTVIVIFLTFLIVFRSGAARLMAMIPSLFAILVMFLVMRLSGATLNVATILIASTVLGASENDQIHFFYHFTEGRKSGDTAAALRHSLRIAGRAIFFATLINAAGFFAFALSRLPPVRQFGVFSSLAFLLSMLADFTALPAALWLLYFSSAESVPRDRK
jgi:predicted RND superfamily exporter protein